MNLPRVSAAMITPPLYLRATTDVPVTMGDLYITKRAGVFMIDRGGSDPIGEGGKRRRWVRINITATLTERIN